MGGSPDRGGCKIDTSGDGAHVPSDASTCPQATTVRLLATRAHIVAEGAGALPLAAALSGHGGTGRVVCIVSGGNIDPERLAAILSGKTPA